MHVGSADRDERSKEAHAYDNVMVRLLASRVARVQIT